MRRAAILILALGAAIWYAPRADPRWLAAMSLTSPIADPEPDDFRCPMDRDVHSASGGKCPRCGMTLVKGYVEPVEYPVSTIAPGPITAGVDTPLRFGISDPRTGRPVSNFEIVHEKLFHLFVVSQDLQFFLHTHPAKTANDDFEVKVRFPKPGLYRLLSDFYPAGATPQLIASTVAVPGDGFHLSPAKLVPDLAPQHAANADVALDATPAAAGMRAALNFRITPDDGIEPYLGTMAHMLAASADLIDMVHQHPYLATDGQNKAYKQLHFDMTFPRPGVYRVWIQFQRKSVVNTVAFNIPVAAFVRQ